LLEPWQRALCCQFGRERQFVLKNTGGHPIFSEFEVTNPESRNTYRVVIRGGQAVELATYDDRLSTAARAMRIELYPL
jgi:hypothetical protein